MRNVPQPKPLPFIGNLPDVDANQLVKSLIQIANSYNGIYQLDAIKEVIIVVYSHDLVNELCDEKRFDKKVPLPLEELREIVGDGLFTAYTDEPNWGKAHRLLTPAFGTMAIRDMFPKMMDIAEQLMLKLERYGAKKPINVAEEMTRLTLDTIALCACDYRFNSFYSEKMHPFVHAMVDALVEAG
jgi:cytochrome P450/NADPH-cytochrome P450 reductase